MCKQDQTYEKPFQQGTTLSWQPREKRSHLKDSRSDSHRQNEGQKWLRTSSKSTFWMKSSVSSKLKFSVKNCFLSYVFLLAWWPPEYGIPSSWTSFSSGFLTPHALSKPEESRNNAFGLFKVTFCWRKREIEKKKKKGHFVVPPHFSSLFGKGTVSRSECFVCCWSQKKKVIFSIPQHTSHPKISKRQERYK